MNRKAYALVTGAYWGFTLTDGMLRMLVLLHFHQLGFSPVQLAFLFLLYELCGVFTNLLGGWIGSRVGLKYTLFAGLAVQVLALLLLSLVKPNWAVPVSVAFVMGMQALSGIAKDLTKMSSKTAVKWLVAPGEEKEQNRALFKWVAALTGSKNALKGIGFFLGAWLLQLIGFAASLRTMAFGLAIVLVVSLFFLREDMGRSKKKVAFKRLFSKRREINLLSVARFWLFASRDVWFVVGLPVFLGDVMGWSFAGVGAFLAAWVVGYGIVQAAAPGFVRREGGSAALIWGVALFAIMLLIAVALQFGASPAIAVLGGLAVFGVVFAVNSSVHSYLILAYSDTDKAALNVGFYYMANAGGRLVGTLLSGVMYLVGGLSACLWTSVVMVGLAVAFTVKLPATTTQGAE